MPRRGDAIAPLRAQDSASGAFRASALRDGAGTGDPGRRGLASGASPRLSFGPASRISRPEAGERRMELRGRSGIVTGAESPLGAAIARALAQAGAQVRVLPEAEALAKEIGAPATTFEEALGGAEPPGFLVEATPLPAGPLSWGEAAGLEEMLALASRPLARIAGAAGRLERGGTVLCVSAPLGPTPEGGWLGPLLAWRAATVAGLAREHAGRGLRVNGLAPVLDGAAKLPGFLKRGGPKMAAPSPLGRAAAPAEVAEAALWLLRAGMVTGLTLPLDGGRGL